MLPPLLQQDGEEIEIKEHIMLFQVKARGLKLQPLTP